MKKKKASKATPSLMACVEAGDVAGLRKLVTSGVGLLDEMEDTSPLAVAIEKNDVEMAKALLELGHNPDIGGIVVPLAEAAMGGQTQIVELLLASGADVNTPGEEGETALMLAAGAGQLETVKRLIEAGGDIKQRDRDGQDALDYALKNRRAKVIDFFLPHFPKVRQDKIARQIHLRESGEQKESALVTQLKKAIDRPTPNRGKRGVASLIRAYESGQHKKFLQLLAAGADPNETNKEGTTILGMVAHSPSSISELLDPLLKAGADPNRGELFRPLKGAASFGAQWVQLLLDAGADVNWADADGRTALMSAAASGHEETVRLLLDGGADPNAEDSQGHSAYWYALTHRSRSVLELLTPITLDLDNAKRPWRKNKEGKSRELCLIDAADAGDIEHVQRLLAEGVRVDVADESADTALHRAAENGHAEIIHALLKAGAPLEAEGGADFTPLFAAAARGQVTSVQALLQAGANIHAKEDAILCYACENEDCLELVELLLKAGAKVNVTGGHYDTTPLHVAVEKDQIPVARRLLDAGANINAKDSNGWTPFLNAALRSGTEMVQMLIDAGADIKSVDHEGRNAYELASKWGKREVAELLKRLLNTV